MLGRWTKTAWMAGSSLPGDSPLFLVDYGLRLLRVILLLSLWHTLFRGRGSVDGLTLPAILTYTLIGEAFSEQFTVKMDVIDSFWNGTIATRFVRPLGIFAQFACEVVGVWTLRWLVFTLPLLLAAPLFGVDPRPVSMGAGAAFVVSLALAVGIGMAIEFALTAFAIGVGWELYAIERVRAALGVLLSGAIIPLALFPYGLGRLFGWLPFAAMASAPLRIYTGTGPILPLLAVQAGWLLVLWPFANALWRHNREKMVAYGG